jgi:hypothetical protein
MTSKKFNFPKIGSNFSYAGPACIEIRTSIPSINPNSDQSPFGKIISQFKANSNPSSNLSKTAKKLSPHVFTNAGADERRSIISDIPPGTFPQKTESDFHLIAKNPPHQQKASS